MSFISSRMLCGMRLYSSWILVSLFNLIGFIIISTLVIHNIFWREGKEEYVPFEVGPYCSTSSYDAASPIFHEIIPALESLNIAVEQVTKKSFTKIRLVSKLHHGSWHGIYFFIVSCWIRERSVWSIFRSHHCIPCCRQFGLHTWSYKIGRKETWVARNLCSKVCQFLLPLHYKL